MAFREKEYYDARDLMEIVALLRDPEQGCPWDKVQTHQTIRMNFLEETCEVLEAIDLEDDHLMCEELGDIMMQVALHSQMAAEAGSFTFDEVCDGVCKKLIYRHPHIFGDAEAPTGANSWDALKNREKGRTTLEQDLASVPATLPALMRAAKTQKRAARWGIGPDRRETAQAAVDAAMAALPGAEDAETALGDALLALTDLARQCGVDPELALVKATRRFAEQAARQN